MTMTTSMYKSLNDCSLCPAGDSVQIWYQKREMLESSMFTRYKNVDPTCLEKTHVLLGTMDIPDENEQYILDRIYDTMQGEIWSPCGQALSLISHLGLMHTSMTVGDVVRFASGNCWICMPVGWMVQKSPKL